MKNPKNLNLTITDKMLQEYQAGTLSGWLDQTGQGLWMEQIADEISKRTGTVTTQKQRGVEVWPSKMGW
ncbi:MAG: hypothetical protein RIR91_927 [Verrucomicrobiota bacterium]|jgi:hypothetical protein